MVPCRDRLNDARTHARTHVPQAAQEGHLDVVNALIAAGANVNTATTDDGQTATYVAAETGELEVLRALLAVKADHAAARTDNGTTPLTIAVEGGHEECAELLRCAARAVAAAV
jgi:ankyrin repeat protein